MKKVKVSVVVPVYNVAPYLKECLDSLVGQSLKEIELICVDDGSTDGSLDMLLEYQEKYANLTVLENKIEGPGAAHARNMGLDHATGEYVLVVDSDDYFHPEMLEKSYKKACDTGADVVIFDAQVFDSLSGNFLPTNKFYKAELIPEKQAFSPLEVKDSLFQVAYSVAWNKLVKKEYMDKAQLRFTPSPVADDISFAFAVLFYAEKITSIGEKLLFYRTNQKASQSKQKNKYPLRVLESSGKIKEMLDKAGLFSEFKSSYYLWTFDDLRSYFSAFSSMESYKTLYTALQNDGLAQLQLLEKNVPHNSSINEAWVDSLQEYSFEEYLYHKYNHNDMGKTGFFHYTFPENKVQSSEKVVLYGAGAMGSAFYAQNVLLQFCDMVAWVDKGYQQLQSPVVGIDSIKNLSYDKILIAIDNKQVQEKIKEEFIKQGIAEEKILLSL